MLFDALVILSPTILLGTYLFVRDIRDAGRARAVAGRVWNDAEELTSGPSFSRAEPPVKRAPEPARKPVAQPSLDDIRDEAARSLAPAAAPTFRTTRREPSLKATSGSSEVFHVDFDEDK